MAEVPRELASIFNEADLCIEPVPLGTRLGPRQTCSINICDRYRREFGADHLRLVLGWLVQSENNANQLVSANITAASKFIRFHPEFNDWSKNFAVMDAMNLGAIRRLHLGDIKAHSIPDAMGVRLFAEMSRHYRKEPPQLDIFGDD